MVSLLTSFAEKQGTTELARVAGLSTEYMHVEPAKLKALVTAANFFEAAPEEGFRDFGRMLAGVNTAITDTNKQWAQAA